MKILISGGAGFIGSAVAERLAADGHDVRLLDNLSPQVHGQDGRRSFSLSRARASGRLVVGDVTSAEDWHRCLGDVTHVLHLAAETGTGQSMYSVGRYCEANVAGTATLLDILRNTEHQVSRVVVASSRAVYGEGAAHCPRHGTVYPHGRRIQDMEQGLFAPPCPICQVATTPEPTLEEAQLRPNSIYAVTKLAQEQLIMTACPALDIEAVALRYQNVYGPGQSLVNPYTGILSIFAVAMLSEQPINVFEDGAETRDFVYIDDVVEATNAALFADKVNGHIVNVGSGRPTSVVQIVGLLAAALGVEPRYRVSGDFRVGDIRHNWADISKAARLFHYEPTWAVDAGISRFARWVQDELEQYIQSGGSYDAALDELRQHGLLHRSR